MNSIHSPFERSIDSELIAGGARYLLVVVVGLSLLTAPAAAQEGGGGDGGSGSASVDVCSQSRFVSVVNGFIQLALFGGVGLGAAMYVGGEAAAMPGFLGEETVDKMRKVRREGIAKILKLTLVPVLMAALIKGSGLAWASCINLVPF